MTNIDATKFAFDSYVTAFSPGNEHMIDQYFASDLAFFNHAQPGQFDLNYVKSGLATFNEKYKDVKSEVKDVTAEEDRLAFRVEHNAFYEPEGKHVTVNVMNLYKLNDGKVKEWRVWFI
jgi:ketosteroid isomerase-like protein